MHGRIKVRTSEEEKARKERERQEKLKVFKHAMQKIQSKRNNGELDRELLEITGKVLTSNPDIYTLWNLRREIINVMRKNPDETEENLSNLHDSEVQLTEYCLKVNPKSYCAWHQREWMLTTRPDPDWKKELALCNTYLKYDERNFHTWDYRRFIVSQCKPPLEDEFKYTTEKLYDNFSNYSAWHYRSKMLVELYPDLEGGRPIEGNHHKHELKMVQSAAFTDPDDTSAWFYLRWLLGAVKKTNSLVMCTVTKTKATVAFNNYVSKEHVKSKLRWIVDGSMVDCEWISCTGNDYDVLWISKLELPASVDVDLKVEYESGNGDKTAITCYKNPSSNYYVGKNKIEFQNKYSEPVIEELNQQLDSCRQLLMLEPDSKWTLLTTTVFLYCIDARKYHKEVIDNLNSLKTVDKLRTGYYDDLIAKWSIEEQLLTDYDESDYSKLKIKFSEKIASLPHLQYYSSCDYVELSNQNLTSQILPSLVILQNCKRISLENNLLTTLRGFPNLDLEELNLKGNNLSVEEIEEFRTKSKFNVIF